MSCKYLYILHVCFYFGVNASEHSLIEEGRCCRRHPCLSNEEHKISLFLGFLFCCRGNRTTSTGSSRPHFAWQLLTNAPEYLVYDNTLTVRDVDVAGKWERVRPTARLCFSPFIHCAQDSVCVTALPRCSGQFQDTEELKAWLRVVYFPLYVFWTPRSLFPALCLCFFFLITAPCEPTKPFTVQKEKADVLSATLLYKIHAYL